MSTPPPIPAGIPPHVVAIAEGMRLIGLADRRRMETARAEALANLGGKKAA